MPKRENPHEEILLILSARVDDTFYEKIQDRFRNTWTGKATITFEELFKGRKETEYFRCVNQGTEKDSFQQDIRFWELSEITTKAIETIYEWVIEIKLKTNISNLRLDLVKPFNPINHISFPMTQIIRSFALYETMIITDMSASFNSPSAKVNLTIDVEFKDKIVKNISNLDFLEWGSGNMLDPATAEVLVPDIEVGQAKKSNEKMLEILYGSYGHRIKRMAEPFLEERRKPEWLIGVWETICIEDNLKPNDCDLLFHVVHKITGEIREKLNQPTFVFDPELSKKLGAGIKNVANGMAGLGATMKTAGKIIVQGTSSVGTSSFTQKLVDDLEKGNIKFIPHKGEWDADIKSVSWNIPDKTERKGVESHTEDSFSLRHTFEEIAQNISFTSSPETQSKQYAEGLDKWQKREERDTLTNQKNLREHQWTEYKRLHGGKPAHQRPPIDFDDYDPD